MPDLQHTVRNSLIDKETTYSLGPAALNWQRGSESGELLYRDVARVNLISYANTGGEQYQAKIAAPAAKPVLIRSHHYASLANFEDRTDTYSPFMRELLRRVAAASPNAQFIAGSTGLWIAWIIVFTIMALLALLMIVILFDAGPPPASIWGAGLLLVIAAPFAWRQLTKGRANTFDPNDPPAGLLGL